MAPDDVLAVAFMEMTMQKSAQRALSDRQELVSQRIRTSRGVSPVRAPEMRPGSEIHLHDKPEET